MAAQTGQAPPVLRATLGVVQQVMAASPIPLKASGYATRQVLAGWNPQLTTTTVIPSTTTKPAVP